MEEPTRADREKIWVHKTEDYIYYMVAPEDSYALLKAGYWDFKDPDVYQVNLYEDYDKPTATSDFTMVFRARRLGRQAEPREGDTGGTSVHMVSVSKRYGAVQTFCVARNTGMVG